MGFLDTDTVEKTDTSLEHSDGDHDRFCHYVRKEDVLEGYIEGKPIVALCGKVWIPSRDPEKFPLCPSCKELYNMIFAK